MCKLSTCMLLPLVSILHKAWQARLVKCQYVQWLKGFVDRDNVVIGINVFINERILSITCRKFQEKVVDMLIVFL